MLTKLRQRLTFANVLSMVALFLALGGSSVAAVSLKRNSVKGKHIARNAVTAPKVKNASLRLEDFAAGQIPQGPKGDKGDNGTADAFARVQADGTLEPGSATGTGPPQSKGVDPADIQKPSAGTYCFGGLDKNLASAVVSMDNAGAAATTTQVASVAIQRGANLGSCDPAHQQARVVITNVDPALAADAAQDGRFTIWVIEG